MTIVINQGPRLLKHIANNVYTTSHKNLIKILTERTEKNMPPSENGSNYKTPSMGKSSCRRDVVFENFLDETGAKTAIT